MHEELRERAALAAEIKATSMGAGLDIVEEWDDASQHLQVGEIIEAMDEFARSVLYARTTEVLALVRKSVGTFGQEMAAPEEIAPFLENALAEMDLARTFLDGRLANEVARRELFGMDDAAIIKTLTRNLREGGQYFSEIKTKYRGIVVGAVQSVANAALGITQAMADGSDT